MNTNFSKMSDSRLVVSKLSKGHVDKKGFTERAYISVIALLTVLATLLVPIVSAEPGTPGIVPARVGDFQEARNICNVGGIPLPTWFLELVTFMQTKECNESLDQIDVAFENAYLRAETHATSPGIPTNDVHTWQGVLIQDFEGSAWGDGWGAIIAPGPSATSQQQPHYIGGGTWAAYKKSVSVYGINPGYPTGLEHDWNGVRIQDFSGGSWGSGGIIGGNNGAWLVAGNHMTKYWEVNGPVALGNPLGWVYQNAEGKYQQDFERGNITELAGRTWVNYNNSTGSQESTITVLPPAGQEAVASASGSNSDAGSAASCNDGGNPVITSPLTVSPMEADTTTPITFTVTVTNTGCGTFAPENLAIGGYYADGAVIDVEQFPGFTLAPGASQSLSVTKVRDVAGQQDYAIAYKPAGRDWYPMYDANGSRGIVTQNVLPAVGNVQSDSASEQPATEPDAVEVNGPDQGSPMSADAAACVDVELVMHDFWASIEEPMVGFFLHNRGCDWFYASDIVLWHQLPDGTVEEAYSFGYAEFAPEWGGTNGSVAEGLDLSQPGSHYFWVTVQDLEDDHVFVNDESGAGNYLEVYVEGIGNSESSCSAELVLWNFTASDSGGGYVAVDFGLDNRGCGAYHTNTLVLMHMLPDGTVEVAFDYGYVDINAEWGSAGAGVNVSVDQQGYHYFWIETVDENGNSPMILDDSGTDNYLEVYVAE